MMRVKSCEEDQRVNIVLRSGMMTDADKGKRREEYGWVYKYLEKEVSFDLNRTKETFMEAMKSFIEASTSRSWDKMLEISAPAEVDPSILTKFWETFMKLLCNSKVVEGLQELINKFSSKEKAPNEHHVVRKIGKHKAQKGQEM